MMVNKPSRLKTDRGSSSSELTVAELIRLAQQGEVVEDDRSPKCKVKSPSSQRAELEPQSGLHKSSHCSPTHSQIEQSTLPPIRASASAPSLEKSEHSPVSSDPHNRQRSSPSKFRVRVKDSLHQLPHIGLMQEDLCDIPVAEALKQILIEQTGSLKQAYKTMDINRAGAVNCFEFEKGLQRAGLYGSPLAAYRDASHLFQELDEQRRGSLKLQDLLGYVPVAPHRLSDTRSEWISYNNKASAQKSHLARKPRWKTRNLEPTPEITEIDHLQKHRALRRNLVDTRRAGLLRMEARRKLVRGLVADEDRQREWHHEHRKMNEQQERIGIAIHDCSKARSELVALQRAMVQLAPEVHKRIKPQVTLSLPHIHTYHEIDDLS